VNLKTYTSFVKRFLLYFSIERIAWLEAYDGSLEYIRALKSFNVDFGDPRIILNAAAGCNEKVFEFLLSNGGSIDTFYRSDISESGTCSMHDQVANFVQSGDYDHIGAYFDMLHEWNVDIDHADKNGNTPLHFVAYMANPEIFDYCVCLGADEFVLNSDKQSPANILQQSITEKNNKRLFNANTFPIIQ